MAKCALVLLSCIAALPLGCGHATLPAAPGSIAETASRPTSRTLSGVWDWILSSNDDQQNKRIEQEEWHLQDMQGKIGGFYIRTVTVVSEDGNPFRCNGQKSFRKQLRFEVQGYASGEDLVLREVSVSVEPGPCDAFAHDLQNYLGRWSGESLTLTWEQEAASGGQARGRQTLFRRPGVTGKSILAESPSPSTPAQRSGIEISGTWTWQTRGVASSGDAQIEQEEWHLEQAGSRIHGFYDRIVTIVSSNGAAFRCNHLTQFATLTRYQIEGSIEGNQVRLEEVGYDAQPSACDQSPKRRLDVYEGRADADEIHLLWGQGEQVLHRNRSVASVE